MATKIGHKDIARMKSKYEGLTKRLHGMRGKGEKVVDRLVGAAEVSASAFAFGAIQGKYGSVEVLGVPADLGAAVILHAGGFLGVAGKASDHLHAFGDGALASFFFTLGRGVGVQWKGKALPGTKAPQIQGDAGPVTQAELDAMTGRRAA